MRIRLLRNLGAGFPPYKEGEEVDAEHELAERLIERGLAEAIIEAVPVKAAIEGVPPPKPRKSKESPAQPAAEKKENLK